MLHGALTVDPVDLHPSAQLALDTVHQRPVRGIPSWLIHVMEHEHIERLAGAEPGAYRRDPHGTYLAFQKAVGTCLLDQWIPDNPLSMGSHGYEGTARKATTGLQRIVINDVVIDSPEAVVAHLEGHAFPALERQVAEIDEDALVAGIVSREREVQTLLGPDILKSGHGFVRFPALAYGTYGYEHYFSAFALYPEVMERHFRLQADVAARCNRAAARAFTEAGLPPLYRLDHDMADSRGTLVRIEWLERLWLPHFARSVEPLVRAGVKLLWHCDGNLWEMVPHLLEAGLAGFQGFQYEDGMDYERICAMRTRDGEELVIIGGASVTTTLPFGTPAQVRDEIDWLVQHGPRTGLFLGGSSTIAPGTPFENIQTLVDGLRHYRERGRTG
ncbi:uroporphyrinogen decarboxylase family protein [Candidatus Latescibacterota bacterium]